VRDIVKTTHPTYPQEKYKGKVDNVEVKVETLNEFFQRGYGIGILRKVGRLKIKSPIEAFPLLGIEDIRIILEQAKLKASRGSKRN
jgi:hypothetical protein